MGDDMARGIPGRTGEAIPRWRLVLACTCLAGLLCLLLAMVLDQDNGPAYLPATTFLLLAAHFLALPAGRAER